MFSLLQLDYAEHVKPLLSRRRQWASLKAAFCLATAVGIDLLRRGAALQ